MGLMHPGRQNGYFQLVIKSRLKQIFFYQDQFKAKLFLKALAQFGQIEFEALKVQYVKNFQIRPVQTNKIIVYFY